MTEYEVRQKSVKWIEQFAGAKQGSSGHKKIIDTFNSYKGFTRYKMTLSDPWCAATASAAMYAVGQVEPFPCYECSCGAMITKAKAAKIWVENDGYIPKTGDKVLYDWDDNGKGDNKGDPEHVGTVVSVKDGYITTIEGNMGEGKVGYRKIEINGRYIRGFITPNFKKLATPEKPILDKKGYKKGDKTIGVLAFKELLLLAYKQKLVTVKVDENKIFGNGTEKAVNQLLKKWNYKQTGTAGEKFIKKLKAQLK